MLPSNGYRCLMSCEAQNASFGDFPTSEIIPKVDGGK